MAKFTRQHIFVFDDEDPAVIEPHRASPHARVSTTTGSGKPSLSIDRRASIANASLVFGERARMKWVRP
jgi:hypothetical protein